VVFGPSEVTQGASGDLELVTRICREMVTRYGFSSLGPVALEGDGAEVFLGRDLIHTRAGYADRTGRQIDALVRELACGALDRAVGLLQPRRGLMDELVDLLIRDETIEGDAFRAVVARSGVALEAPSKTDVEAAQVGV